MQAALSFEQAPPFSVPVRFFVTAPWFGAAAGLLLAWHGELAVLSRWTPSTLALTHLAVLGLMLQAMTGALFQFVPVAAGGNVWQPRRVAAVVHPLLVVGALVLVAAFLGGVGTLFRVAALLLSLAAALLIAVGLWALIRTPAQGATVQGLRFALVGLAVTVVLGATLAEGFAANHDWPLMALANVHAAWGLGGWALMLLVAVSYFVVPMFQLTPPYPPVLARALPTALLVVLTAWTIHATTDAAVAAMPVWLAGIAIGAVFAGATLQLQSRRRRKVADATFRSFRFAMACLLLVVASAVVFEMFPGLGQHPRAAWWLGVLTIGGVFASAINGMLYKIVPFLCWLHLQRVAPIGVLPPSTREMISGSAMLRQTNLHFAAVALLALAGIHPAVAGLAGIAFALAQAWLGWNLVGAVRAYRRFKDRMCAAAPHR